MSGAQDLVTLQALRACLWSVSLPQEQEASFLQLFYLTLVSPTVAEGDEPMTVGCE